MMNERILAFQMKNRKESLRKVYNHEKGDKMTSYLLGLTYAFVDEFAGDSINRFIFFPGVNLTARLAGM